MPMKYFQVIACLILVTIGQRSFSQNVFSEEVFDYKRAFLPYDMPYVFPLEDKQFIMLREEKKNLMMLGRYDQYFFEQWEKEVEFDRRQSAPQLFLKGDSIITYSYTKLKKVDSIKVQLRFFDLESGAEINKQSYSFPSNENDLIPAGIIFSEDHSKFVVKSISEQPGELEFSIFKLGEKKPFKIYRLEVDALTGSSMHRIHLSNNGDLLLASVDPGDFKSQVFFWGAKSGDHAHVESNFFLERPADKIENIQIVRQGPSSYFIAFSATIEDELIGFSVLGVNVILKTVLVAYNQNLNGMELGQLYENYYVTAERQKEKRLRTPELLDDFRFVKSLKTPDNDIILFFEELQVPVGFHDLKTSSNMPWKHKSDEDKFYFGGDLLLYCFDDTGQLRWKKTIQKTQFSQGSTLGLSFIPRILNDRLDLLIYDSSKGGNFYVMSLDTSDGKLDEKINLLPDKKFEFAKRYSCWLSPKSVILLGIAPGNIRKRTLMLVEF
jgi:hypothetical protein